MVKRWSIENWRVCELCEHIVIDTRWYQLGIQLKLDVTQLDVIDKENSDVTQKTAKMFQLWLSTNPLATRNTRSI